MTSSVASSNNKVSIIMPVYNDEAYIADAIDSVLKQTHQNLELIIIDDRSNDESVRIAESFSDPRIKLFKLAANSGAAAARNVGLRNASGDYVAFLDADDYWTQDKLEKQIAYMQDNDCQFCASQYFVVSSNGEKLYLMDSPRTISKRAMRRCCYIGCLTAVYNRSVVGLIQVDERLKKRNDYAIWLQAMEKTSVCLSIPEPLAFYRLNQNGLSHKKSSLFKWHYRLHRWQMKTGSLVSFWYACVNAIFAIIKKRKYRKGVNQ